MPLHVGSLCPSLQGATEWIDNAINVQELTGRPFMIIFWSMSCPACLEHLPLMQRWKMEHADAGLKLVAVHVPYAQSGSDAIRVKQLLQSRQITLPCALDNELSVSREFQTENILPYYFMFDKNGKLKSRAASEAGLKLLTSALMREIHTALI